MPDEPEAKPTVDPALAALDMLDGMIHRMGAMTMAGAEFATKQADTVAAFVAEQSRRISAQDARIKRLEKIAVALIREREARRK